MNEDLEKIKSQILLVRETGMTNMFDVNAVQRIAYDMGLYELVMFLEDRMNTSRYSNFIITGVFN